VKLEQYWTVGRISYRGNPKLSNKNRENKLLKGVFERIK
jgi:hypothetical protein